MSVSGIDHSETFSPVAKMQTIRLLLGIAATDKIHCSQFDISVPSISEIVPAVKEISSMIQPQSANQEPVDDDDRDWEFEKFDLRHPLARNPIQYDQRERVTKTWIEEWKREHLNPETYAIQRDGEPYAKFTYEKPFPQIHVKAEAVARGQFYEPYLFYEIRVEYYHRYPLCFNLQLRDDAVHEVVYDCRSPRSSISIGIAERAALRRTHWQQIGGLQERHRHRRSQTE